MKEKTVRTISDIAKLAGVSKSTVSRALNNSPLISEETRQRIQSIARENQFLIHQPARQLSLRQSNTIAFVTHGYAKNLSYEDLFLLEMLGSISSALAAENYDLMMVYVDPYDTKWPAQYLGTGRVDGFILMTSCRKQYHIKTLIEQRAPFIAWSVPHPRQNYCTVSGDNVTGGRQAAEHLFETGRTRLGFLGGPQDELEVHQRFQGFKAAHQEAGVPFNSELVVYGDFSTATAREGVQELLSKAPDLQAIFANSDLMAIAAMRALRERGFRVPEDVAVVGYDDLSVAEHSEPPLTTIRQHIPLAGRMLVQNLIQYLQTGVVTHVSLPVELVVRKTT